MCTGGGHSYSAPKPKPLPAPPPAIENGAPGVLINEGYGLGTKLQDLAGIHGLVIPFRKTPKPKSPLTPQQTAEQRLAHINTLNTDSPEFSGLSDSDREYVLRRTMQQNRRRGLARTGVVTAPENRYRTHRYLPGLINNDG